MALVSGPFLSLDASGTVFKTLTASIWKGRNYMRGYFKPTTSQDPGCIAARNAFKAAVLAWQVSYQETKDAWNEAARDVYPPVSGFNYFVGQYCLQSGVPTIPPVAPKKSKTIHGR
mgnify:CR=1 FL=1